MTKRVLLPRPPDAAYREYAGRPLPVTDSLYERLFCVPVYHDLADKQIDDLAKTGPRRPRGVR